MKHIEGLAELENSFKALLQSKSLLRYYFHPLLSGEQIQMAMNTRTLLELGRVLNLFHG